MNKEAYVSFETAKLLKEKGFTEFCLYYYQGGNPIRTCSQDRSCYEWNNNHIDEEWYSAPTQQMAVRWVWEEKGLNINAIYGDYPSQKRSFWMPQIDSLDGCYGVDDEDFFREYDSREECIEAALQYVLINLI